MWKIYIHIYRVCARARLTVAEHSSLITWLGDVYVSCDVIGQEEAAFDEVVQHYGICPIIYMYKNFHNI